MTIKITPNDKGNPPGKLAEAELHFADGPLEGLKLIGFSVWERRGARGQRRPQRHVPGALVQRSTASAAAFRLLRPIGDTAAQNKLRELILEAFQEFEERAALTTLTATGAPGGVGRFPARASAGASTPRESLGVFSLVERGLHAAVDDVPRQHRVRVRSRNTKKSSSTPRLGNARRASCRPLRSAAINRRRDAPVAEREQRLVVRVPLRLDVEVDVVDVRP